MQFNNLLGLPLLAALAAATPIIDTLTLIPQLPTVQSLQPAPTLTSQTVPTCSTYAPSFVFSVKAYGPLPTSDPAYLDVTGFESAPLHALAPLRGPYGSDCEPDDFFLVSGFSLPAPTATPATVVYVFSLPNGVHETSSTVLSPACQTQTIDITTTYVPAALTTTTAAPQTFTIY